VRLLALPEIGVGRAVADGRAAGRASWCAAAQAQQGISGPSRSRCHS